MPITTFSEAQAALRPLYHNVKQPYTLDTMRQLMRHLGNPQDAVKVMHIAGTSGKTSTAYYSAALLHAEGSSVGLAVSPHVDSLAERAQINGQPLPELEFCVALETFLGLIADCPVEPSYFEAMAAFAYWLFADRQVDYAVVEVGLGGLLDGTNVIARRDKTCVITDIGLDHTELLGDTLGAIAEQKAGIIMPGNTVYMYEQTNDVMQAVQRRCDEQIATLHTVPQNFDRRTDIPPFQRRNLGLAVAAVSGLLARPLDASTIDRAAHIVVPGRMEQFAYGDKTIILDGSHNQQKLEAVLTGVQQRYPGQSIAALVGFIDGNQTRWQDSLRVILPAVNHCIITSFASEMDYPKRSVDPQTCQSFVLEQGYAATVIADAQTALQTLLARPERILLVTGSFYLLNHIRPVVRQL